MSREILDCLKRERDICVKNVIHGQNTAFMFTPALNVFFMAAFMPEVLLLSSPGIIKEICIHPYTFHGVHAIPNFLPGNRDRLRYNLGIISGWFGDHLRDGIICGSVQTSFPSPTWSKSREQVLFRHLWLTDVPVLQVLLRTQREPTGRHFLQPVG